MTQLDTVIDVPQEKTMDLYPTRLKSLDRPYVTRVDPVVHRAAGEPFEGPLDADQVRDFDHKGYLLLPGHLSGETLKRLINDAEQLRADMDPGDDRVITEPGGDTIRSIFEIHLLKQSLAAAASSTELAGVARQLMGSDVYLHQTRVNYKPGFEGKEFYWHSDFETWHSEDGMPRMRAVSCVITLSDNHASNGPLMIIPGSHKLFAACLGETPENHYLHSLKKQEYGVPSHDALAMMVEKWGIDLMTGPAGTVVFFDCNAMHGSSGNITPLERNNLFFVFNSIDNKLVEPFCGTAPRPEYIASRNFKVV